MKIAFYTLPKAERREICDKIEELHSFVKNWEEQYFHHLNRANEAKVFLDDRKKELNDLREKYSFD